MSKSIKISEESYHRLREIQHPRETYAEVVARLIELHEILDKASPLIGGAERYLRWQQEQREKREKPPIYAEIDGKRVLVDGLHRAKELPSVIGTDMQGNPLIKRQTH